MNQHDEILAGYAQQAAELEARIAARAAEGETDSEAETRLAAIREAVAALEPKQGAEAGHDAA